MKFCGEVGRGPGRNRLNFGDDPDYFVDPGSFSMDSLRSTDRADILQRISASYGCVMD